MKHRLIRCVSLFFVALSLGVAVPAQQVSGLRNQNPALEPQAAGFPVTGRVVCADTQRAARFAQVALIPMPAAGNTEGASRRITARTDLDGRFIMESVPAGEYYVTAELAGYVNEASAVQSALSANTTDALNSIASVPRVQVTNGGAAAQISLQRGAVLAGDVAWDDGTPAAGVQVYAQPATAGTGLNVSPFGGRGGYGVFHGAQTDDRGRFRLSGLAPGSYLLRATVQSPLPSPGSRFERLENLSVYAPNKFRRTDGTVFALTSGEERADVTVSLALSALHAVAGQVSASSGSVRSGSVMLTDQSDSSLNRRGTINLDGTFSIHYVPAGTYTLRVQASSQVPGPAGFSGDRTPFQPLQESITVVDSDLSGLSLTVTPVTTPQ